MLAFIDTLPEAQKTVLALSYASGLSADEIAITLNISVSAVYNRLYSARKAVKNILQKGVKKMSESIFASVMEEWVDTSDLRDAVGGFVRRGLVQRAVYVFLSADKKARLRGKLSCGGVKIAAFAMGFTRCLLC